VLEIAAALCFGIGMVHSYLGERFILIRLFKRGEVPHLFGSDYFTKGTLRFAWHITTIIAWGLGYLVFSVSRNVDNLAQVVLLTTGVVFSLSAVFAFAFTKGKHLSWIVFGLIAALVIYVGLSS